MVGLRRPSSGEVRLYDEDLQALTPNRRVALERRMGVLFQSGALFSSLTVIENIALPFIEHSGLPLV